MPPAEIIRSRTNPLVRRLRALRDKSHDELCLIEGPTLLGEALDSGVEIVEVAVCPRFERRPEAPALLARVAAQGLAARRVDDAILQSLSETETSQGLLALARRPASADEAILGCGRAPLVVVAMGLQNPGNLGGLLRTAEAAGASGAFLTAGTADPLSWKALRGSMGSAFRLPHARNLEPATVVERLRKAEVRILATVAEGGTPYKAVRFDGPVAIALGSERAGLPQVLLDEADERVSIPLRPPVESLNVGVAAGILLFEAARQRAEGRG